MTALQRRNRVVVFRLTEDEYETLKCACHSAGARNLSDFTRSELLNRLESGPQELPYTVIEERLSGLQSQLQCLIGLVQDRKI